LKIIGHTKILLISALFVLLCGCTIKYSFTGAAISPEIKTISIQFFQNKADLVNPSLSQDFTEALKDKFTSQTNLELINDVGDLNFEGEITGYSTKPTSIQGNETAAMNRLTVNIRVKFTNLIEPDNDFDSSFSAFEDYDSSQSLDDVEGTLIPQILEKLTEDIFNKSVAKW
jgi:hypothetical protein